MESLNSDCRCTRPARVGQSQTMFRRLFFMLFVLIAMPLAALGQGVHFERITSNITDDTLTLSRHEELRIERFLRRVYPTRAMEYSVRPRLAPLLRKARYDVVKVRGMRYIIVGYVAEFEGDQFVHDLAIYRFTHEGPNQVWRSRAWVANYYGLSFETAEVGSRVLVLFQEGGLDPSGFSLSGVLSFAYADSIFFLHDLTPRLPHLQASTHFPGHALFGQKVILQQTPTGEIILAASDQDFTVSNEDVTPTNFWKFNPRRGRFEIVKSPDGEPTMTERSTREGQ